ncbi:DUF736 family protein [Thalassospira sp. SM2505]
MNQLKFSDDRQFATGTFVSLTVRLDVELHAIKENWDKGKPPVAGPDGAGRPAYSVYAKGIAGVVDIGAVWVKTVKKQGPNFGKQFFTMTLDDMSFPEKINLAAYEAGEPGVYDLKWERPRGAMQNAA